MLGAGVQHIWVLSQSQQCMCMRNVKADAQMQLIAGLPACMPCRCGDAAGDNRTPDWRRQPGPGCQRRHARKCTSLETRR